MSSFRLPMTMTNPSVDGGDDNGAGAKIWTQEYWQSVYDRYQRPSDWLTLPSVVSGDQKIVILHAVYDHDANFFATQCQGAYTVDWGDGTSTNHATNTVAYKNFTYSSFAGTECSRGYRQAIITITPQAGQNLTVWNPNVKHNQATLNAYNTGHLDIKMAGANMTSFTLGGTNPTLNSLEQFDFVGVGSFVTQPIRFSNLKALRRIVQLDTGTATNFNGWITGCKSLETIPLINTTNGTNFSLMFADGNDSLETIPGLNTGNGTLFNLMFRSASNLLCLPLFDTSKGTNFNGMLQFCNLIQTIPLFNTILGTNFGLMFQGCWSLVRIPLLNTANGTDFSQMLENCYVLEALPLLNTAKGTLFTSMLKNCRALPEIPLLDTGLGTNFSGMLASCYNLKKVPLLNTANGTNFNNMFANAWVLDDVPALNTAKGTNFQNFLFNCYCANKIPLFDTALGQDMSYMFYFGGTIQEMPAINLNSATTLTEIVNFCPSLSKVGFVNIKKTISIANMKLSTAAIVVVFNNLATVAGQTITISGNWGTAGLSAGDRAIATGKGWSIVG